jgi:HNH endonuclease
MARQWRASSKARAEKIGVVLPSIPSIDEVQAHLEAAGDRCCYCSVKFSSKKTQRMTMDHGVPISRGGGADTGNLRLCCYACNHAKGPLTETEFVDLLATVQRWTDRGNSLLIRLRGGYWFYRGPAYATTIPTAAQ